MKVILSKIVKNKHIMLLSLENGGYQIKSGRLTQTFKQTPFETIFTYYMRFK